jgi:uncharacterized delta-60 repeat protein
MLPFAGAAVRAGATLDPAFGSGGKVVTDFGASEQVLEVAEQRDGRTLAVGVTISPDGDVDLAVARYRADGTLDPTLGGDGRLVAELGGMFVADVAVQPDGKIVVAGVRAGRFALARFAANGTPDAGFGSGGIVVPAFGLEGGLFVAVVVQASGRIVAAGRTADEAASVIARFSADGKLDATFGDAGRVISDRPLRDVALGRRGTIVAAGTRRDPSKISTGDGLPADLVVARYESNGSLDRSFGGDGVVAFDLRRSSCCYAESVAVRRDGRVVVGGYGESIAQAAVTRLRNDGRIDTSFGRNGWTALTNLGAGVRDLALDPRERIVVATGLHGRGDFGVVRLTPRGEVDGRFGSGGVTTTDFGAVDDARSVAVRRDGRIVVGGYSGGRPFAREEHNDFALVRHVAPLCVVPNVRGETLAEARELLVVYGCLSGRTRHARSARVPRGRVVSQRPSPGARRAEDSRVALVVSRG